MLRSLAVIFSLSVSALSLGCGDPSAAPDPVAPPEPETPIVSANVRPEECPEIAPSSRAELEGWLHARDYAALEARLAGHFEAYRQNALCEDALDRAYTALGDNESVSLHALRAWRDHSPGSPEAHAALARGLRFAGYDARGGKYANETPAESMQRMHALHAEGIESARRTADLEPTLSIPYTDYASMMRARGDGRRAIEALQALLALDPRTYQVRRRAINANNPRWGGSLEVMQQIADEAQAFVGSNRRLAVLPGMIWAYKGDHLVGYGEERDHARAIEYYTRALAHGDNRNYWSLARAEAYLELNDLRAAVKDATRAVRLAPRDEDAYELRAKIYMLAESWEKALADLDRALELKPGGYWPLRLRGGVHQQLNNVEAALADYRGAMEARRGESSWPGGQIGFLLVERLDRPAEAEPWLADRIEDAPDVPFYWFLYGRALEGQGKAEARGAYERFLALAQEHGVTDDPALSHALAYLSDGGPKASGEAMGLPGASLVRREGR